MKRILTIILDASMALTALAQSDREPLYSSADGSVTFNMLSHLGYGYHFVKTEAFEPISSGETFLNVFQIGLYPAENLGFELGADIAYNYFRAKNRSFTLDSDRKIQVVDIPTAEGNIQRFRSNIGSVSANFPLVVKGLFGKFELGAGAEARLNFAGSTSFSYRQDNRYVSVEERKAKLNLFNYDILAVFSMNDMGIYFKYYPKGSRFLPEGSVDFSWMTLGIVLLM